MLTSTFAADDVAAAAACRSSLQRVFDTLGERVRNRPGPFLAGDSLGAEDLALAVLLGAVPRPEEQRGCRDRQAAWLEGRPPGGSWRSRRMLLAALSTARAGTVTSGR
jgi:glutathione S-transferase